MLNSDGIENGKKKTTTTTTTPTITATTIALISKKQLKLIFWSQMERKIFRKIPSDSGDCQKK